MTEDEPQVYDDGEMRDMIAAQLPRLRAYVRLQMDPALRQKESVSDVVQSVCREFLDRAEQFEYQGDHQLRSWLCAAALHKVQQKLRFHRADKRDIRKEVEADPNDSDKLLLECYATHLTPSRHAIANEQIERIERAFDQLPGRYRDVVICSRILGLPHAEIGERLGLNENATRSLLFRALTKLSILVEKQETGSE